MRHRYAALLCLALLAAALPAGADELELSYTVSFEKPESAVAEVTTTISGLTSEGLRLIRPPAAAPGWFDVTGARDSSGRELKVAATEGGYYVSVKDSPRITVTYTIFPGALSGYGHIGLVCSDYAVLDGSQLFLIPGEEHDIVGASLRYDAPRKWRPVLGWPKARDSYVADSAFAPLRMQLERSLICFGNFRRISKGFGTNTLSVYALDSLGDQKRDKLAEALQKIYGELYETLRFETGREYIVVCIGDAPDGEPVAAGAWSDGMALTLAEDFTEEERHRQVAAFSRLVTSAYFAEEPYGVRLLDADWWFYPAAIRWGEQIGLAALGLSDENTFYGRTYTDYIAEASADNSQIDVAFGEVTEDMPRAVAFLRRVKAPLLSMALDYEMRAATAGELTLAALVRALRERADSPEGVDLERVVAELTQTDFTPFFDNYLRSRTLILPLWPSFVEHLRGQLDEGPGPVAATVDGVPIYEREVMLLTASAPDRATFLSDAQRYGAALKMLVDEKLMDKALMKRRIRAVPEVFWQFRTYLPPRVMRVIITKKRQILKDILFEEWQALERDTSKVAGMPAERAGAGAP